MAVLAIVLLFAGGLGALQSVTMLSALPFTFVHAFNLLGPGKGTAFRCNKNAGFTGCAYHPRAIQNPRSWQQRLGLIMHYPHTREEVERYIDQTVRPAFTNLQTEFKRRHLDVSIQNIDDGLAITCKPSG